MGEVIDWRCFHCGELFTDRQEAGLHFGIDEGKTPACLIKGAEGGLIKALRDAERQADDAMWSVHQESTDAAKAFHQQRCRHDQALIAAEQVGYDRGLADGRAEITTLRAKADALAGVLAKIERLATPEPFDESGDWWRNLHHISSTASAALTAHRETGEAGRG